MPWGPFGSSFVLNMVLRILTPERSALTPYKVIKLEAAIIG